MLQEQTDDQLLPICLTGDLVPYAFTPKPQAWDAFRNEINVALGVAADAIRIVGSARLGFSLKPHNNLRQFTETSDIDVAIVNPDLFDQLWIALLTAAYPRSPVTERSGGWLRERKNELYTGWLSPTESKLDRKLYGAKAEPVLNFSVRWFDALKKASGHCPRAHENIGGRLYRTWGHLELYHLHSLAELRKTLAA